MKLPPRLLYPLIFVAGAAIGVGVYFGVMSLKQKPSGSQSATTPSVSAESPSSSAPANEKPVEVPTSTAPSVVLDVTWDAVATKLATSTAREIVLSFSTDTSIFDIVPVDGATDYFGSMWQMGSVSSGELMGGKVYLLETIIDVPGGDIQNLIIVSGGKAYFLPKYSPTDPGSFVSRAMETRSDIAIPSLDTADTMTLENGKTLVREGNGFNYGFFDRGGAYILPQSMSGLKRVAKTQDGRQVYAVVSAQNSSTGGCLYLFLPNGQLVRYSSTIPVKASEKTDAGGIHPDMTWNTGYGNTDVTGYNDRTIGGCGATGCTDVVSDAMVGPMAGLAAAGVTAAGDRVYTPATPATHPLVKAAYEQWYVPDGTKPSLAVFIRKHPAALLLWKDAIGRWVRLTVADAMPMTECGKPVIYLYPEKTTNVSVKLPPFVSVTKSEPTYPASGWNVIANPNGTLVTQDGAAYGSLYWEGTGVGYQTPREGFVVKDGEIASFLAMTLKKYGLNEKESQEFRDFWAPKMTGAPYYRVSFLTNDWSKAAPLFVSPKPATSIRIFMDWQKLHAPISIEEPKIVTPERDGFTLVEWGGLLRK